MARGAVAEEIHWHIEDQTEAFLSEGMEKKGSGRSGGPGDGGILWKWVRTWTGYTGRGWRGA